MKGCSTGFRNLATSSSRPRCPSRPLCSSACRPDEAESSSNPIPPRPSRPGKGEAYPGESKEDAWSRNLREVQEFRRKRAAMHIKTPFIPSSAKPPPPKPSPTQTTLSTLLATGAALGHASTLLNPAYAPYIYGSRSGLSIIDLDQTLPILRRTAALVRDVVKADGVVLIVGTREGLGKCLDKAKDRLGDNGYTAKEWLPGLLTNSETIFGIQPMVDKSFLPDLAIFLNPSENLPAIRECTRRNIPTVGIVDSDMDPRAVTYPIPANMESIRTAELILGTLTVAGQEGRRLRIKEAEARKSRDQARRARDREEGVRRGPQGNAGRYRDDDYRRN